MSSFDSPDSWQPVAANPDPVLSQQSGPMMPGAQRRTRLDPAVVLAVMGFILLGILAIAVAAYLLFAVGAVAATIAFVMALVPLAIVLAAVRRIDRWEPEPRAALMFALLWGAVASVAIALIFSYAAQILGGMSGGTESVGAMFFSTVIQAPIIEELSKGLGVLILFWVFRRNFDGPIDGLVYGAMVGVGFAFTENIQYFGLALSTGDIAGVSEIFFLRGLLSPFAHVMFTACTGIVLGFASRRSSSIGAIGYFLLGLVPAVVLHAFWNGASFFVTNFYAYYVVVQVPLFLIALGFVSYLRRMERRMTAVRLAEYADVGWFTRTEVALLSTGAGRNFGRAWANRHALGSQFAAFTKDATRLAFARQRVVSSRDRAGAQRAEADLLDRISAHRHALAMLPPVPPQLLPR